jgi:RimJ/RimL family protein N-acetyltransferase
MPGAAFLSGERVTLRTVEEEDLDLLNRNVNDPRVRRPLTSADPVNGEQTREFFEEVVSGDDSVNLLICVEGGDEPVGDIVLFKIQDRRRWAEIAISIAPEHWGNGYATEASELIVDYAFSERNLHRLQTRVIEPNDASARVWEKLGFTLEGTLRENQYYDGEYVGTRYYGLLEDEWEGR